MNIRSVLNRFARLSGQPVDTLPIINEGPPRFSEGRFGFEKGKDKKQGKREDLRLDNFAILEEVIGNRYPSSKDEEGRVHAHSKDQLELAKALEGERGLFESLRENLEFMDCMVKPVLVKQLWCLHLL
jgi:hypothetical protein